MEIEKTLRTYRKRPLFESSEAASGSPEVLFDRDDIQRIIPQRPPVLYVDAISSIDHEEKTISGTRHIPADDPVFKGHFPDMPIYPGTYTVEMIGQLSLCLFYFVHNVRNDIATNAEPAPVRATRILGAHFLYPIRPGDRVELLARGLAYDEYFGTAIGQALVNGRVSCVSAGEVCFI